MSNETFTYNNLLQKLVKDKNYNGFDKSWVLKHILLLQLWGFFKGNEIITLLANSTLKLWNPFKIDKNA